MYIFLLGFTCSGPTLRLLFLPHAAIVCNRQGQESVAPLLHSLGMTTWSGLHTMALCRVETCGIHSTKALGCSSEETAQGFLQDSLHFAFHFGSSELRRLVPIALVSDVGALSRRVVFVQGEVEVDKAESTLVSM